jgi:hypothetical protein
LVYRQWSSYFGAVTESVVWDLSKHYLYARIDNLVA